MIFRLRFSSTFDASAFTEWAAEAGHPAPIDTADRHDAPYGPGHILEIRIEDGSANEFAELWADWIVSFGML